MESENNEIEHDYIDKESNEKDDMKKWFHKSNVMKELHGMSYDQAERYIKDLKEQYKEKFRNVQSEDGKSPMVIENNFKYNLIY